jgi:hypothetical protein
LFKKTKFLEVPLLYNLDRLGCLCSFSLLEKNKLCWKKFCHPKWSDDFCKEDLSHNPPARIKRRKSFSEHG